MKQAVILENRLPAVKLTGAFGDLLKHVLGRACFGNLFPSISYEVAFLSNSIIFVFTLKGLFLLIVFEFNCTLQGRRVGNFPFPPVLPTEQWTIPNFSLFELPTHPY
jgi:hypothetical protein